MKKENLKNERVMILESWRDMETDALKNDFTGSGREFISAVEEKFPRKVKVKIDGDENQENYDWIFPDEEKKLGNI
jgi:hypothetical protein